MSKQQKSKDSQLYTKDGHKCSLCAHYTDTKVTQGTFVKYTTIKNRRCSFGGFAVQASACCKFFERF